MISTNDQKVNLSTTAGADVSTINAAVSQRIKQFRSQKKISLDELARRSGVSKGMLVEIEGCKANPSIALLCKIAAAMGVSVADVVNVASEPISILSTGMLFRCCGAARKAAAQN